MYYPKQEVLQSRMPARLFICTDTMQKTSITRVFLAPTGAQGVNMSVMCVCACYIIQTRKGWCLIRIAVNEDIMLATCQDKYSE